MAMAPSCADVHAHCGKHVMSSGVHVEQRFHRIHQFHNFVLASFMTEGNFGLKGLSSKGQVGELY